MNIMPLSTSAPLLGGLFLLCFVCLSSAPSPAAAEVRYRPAGAYFACDQIPRRWGGGHNATSPAFGADASTCAAAAAALALPCATASTASSGIYPAGCYWNLAATSCSSRLRFNPSASAPAAASSTRVPICRAENAPADTPRCAAAFGDGVPVGSVVRTRAEILAEAHTCPGPVFGGAGSVPAAVAARPARLFFNYNRKEAGEDSGVFAWPLDTGSFFDSTPPGTWYGSQPSEFLYEGTAAMYDTTEGLAVDQERGILYTIESTKWDVARSTSYQRRLLAKNVSAGPGELADEILWDVYPYLCHPLGTTSSHYSLLALDEVNQRLWWLDAESISGEAWLYSLDLTAPVKQVELEAKLSSTSTQWGQLSVDCNGAVWFTEIFDGLFYYRRGLQDAVLMVPEAQLGAVLPMRVPGTNQQHWLLTQQSQMRLFTAPPDAWASGTPANCPSCPAAVTNDRYINLAYNYPSDTMCFQMDRANGDYWVGCYNYSGDANLVFNFLPGAFPRKNAAVLTGFLAESAATTGSTGSSSAGATTGATGAATGATTGPTGGSSAAPTASGAAPTAAACGTLLLSLLLAALAAQQH